MRKISLLISLVLLLGLLGCINFQPKNESVVRSLDSEDTGIPMKEGEKQDDLAVEDSIHLRFKGVPIDGTLEQFVLRMERSGFQCMDVEDGTAVLKGDFAAFKECTVFVSTLSGKDLVSRIAVQFPERDQWQYLYGDYKNLKDLLTEKYGKPSSCVERFQKHYVEPDDMMKMLYVQSDKCNYETTFATEKGTIVLSIEHGEYSSCFVMLAYRDKVNNQVIREHAINDL